MSIASQQAITLVMEFSPSGESRVVPRDGELVVGALLTGFRLPVSEMFGWLRESD